MKLGVVTLLVALLAGCGDDGPAGSGAVPYLEPGCGTDGDCAEGECLPAREDTICTERCNDADELCLGGYCFEGQCWPACEFDRDCAPGWFCGEVRDTDGDFRGLICAPDSI